MFSLRKQLAKTFPAETNFKKNVQICVQKKNNLNKNISQFFKSFRVNSEFLCGTDYRGIPRKI